MSAPRQRPKKYPLSWGPSSTRLAVARGPFGLEGAGEAARRLGRGDAGRRDGLGAAHSFPRAGRSGAPAVVSVRCPLAPHRWAGPSAEAGAEGGGTRRRVQKWRAMAHHFWTSTRYPPDISPTSARHPRSPRCRHSSSESSQPPRCRHGHAWVVAALPPSAMAMKKARTEAGMKREFWAESLERKRG